jgi:hypothetical protein
MDPATRQVFANLMASVVRDQRAQHRTSAGTDPDNAT